MKIVGNPSSWKNPSSWERSSMTSYFLYLYVHRYDLIALNLCLTSQSLFVSQTVNIKINIKMGKYVWSCSLCLHETKRKSNVIRHIRLVHGIDPHTIENNDTNGINTDTDSSRENKNFCCSGCSYNTVKKYNLMRHLKSVHLPNDRIQQEEEQRHYNRKEFEEIINRLKATAQSTPENNPKMVKVMLVRLKKSEAKIREGYLGAMEILTR